MRPIMMDAEVEDRPKRPESDDPTLKEQRNVAAERSGAAGEVVAPELSVVSAAGTSSGSTSPSAASASTKGAEPGKGKHTADGCAAGATEASERATSTLMDQFYELVQYTLTSCASAGSATVTQLRQTIVVQHNVLGSMYSSTAGLAGSAAVQVQQAVQAALRAVAVCARSGQQRQRSRSSRLLYCHCRSAACHLRPCSAQCGCKQENRKHKPASLGTSSHRGICTHCITRPHKRALMTLRLQRLSRQSASQNPQRHLRLQHQQ